MLESRMHEKFPEDSANRDYDVFEELPDGSTIWRASVFGMESAELKLRELTKETGNKLFALHLQDPPGCDSSIEVRSKPGVASG